MNKSIEIPSKEKSIFRISFGNSESITRTVAYDRLKQFYERHVQKFALEHGCMYFDESQKDKWKYPQEYEALNDMYYAIVGQFELVIIELVRNAKEHGNQNSKEKSIHIGASWIGEVFCLIVGDEGLGMGSSNSRGDGMGMNIISFFATEMSMRVGDNGFSISVYRDLEDIIEEQEKFFLTDYDVDQNVLTAIRKKIKNGDYKVELTEKESKVPAYFWSEERQRMETREGEPLVS